MELFQRLTLAAGCALLLAGCHGDVDAGDADAGEPRSPEGGRQVEAREYAYTWESLRRAPVPGWFRDAKFGIFIHWGPYSVPGWSDGEHYAEWYSTRMYRQPTFIAHHREHWGEPGEFGYKDFIPMFRGEDFDAGEWSELFLASGARYVIPVAEHHDGFAMWDTEFTPWNSVDMGPRIDFIGELGEAVRARGLKFGVSYHRERHWGFYTDSMNTYLENAEPLEEIRLEIERFPEAASLYGPFGLSEDFMIGYKARALELVSSYQPDFLWIDDSPANSLHPEAPAVERFINKYHLEMLVDYMNLGQAWGKPVYFNNKRWHRSNYPPGVGVDEKDYLRIDAISDIPWHSSGGMDHSYGYDRSEDERDSYKSVEELVETLVDVVSKNGNFLLNIGPMANGVIPQGQRSRLLGIGEWLGTNGEAIYGTRPWVRFGGEGIRFTAKEGLLYATLFEWPAGPVELDLGGVGDEGPTDVRLLGKTESIDWRFADGELTVDLGDAPGAGHTWVLRIALGG